MNKKGENIGSHRPRFDTVNNAVNFAEVNKQAEADMVNHPPHYTSHPSGVECIQVTEHMNFNLGNVVKYVWRCDDKHEIPIEDLEKAEFYLKREIARRKTKLAG